MVQYTTTTGHTEGPAAGKMKKETSRIKKAGREIDDKYEDMKQKASVAKEDMKQKASEVRERFGEKASETASMVKRESRAVAHKGREAGNAVYDALSENLFPAILTGIGAAWLTAGIVRMRSESARPEPGIYRESVSTAQETLSDVSEKAKDVTRRAKAEARRTRDKSKEVISNNPLYLAGSLMAIGALIGLAFPETRREKRFYGEMREELQEGGKKAESEMS